VAGLATSSGGKIAQAILAPGRVGSVAFELVVQCPHPTGTQIKIKKQIELAGRRLITPYRRRRLLGTLDSGPQ
jgi:hypothetical protein